MVKERRVVVTGMGAITPVGNNIEDFWNSLVEGKSGISTITRFDPGDSKTRIAGEIKDFNPEPIISAREVKRMDLFCQYALCAAAEAILRAVLKRTAHPIGCELDLVLLRGQL